MEHDRLFLGRHVFVSWFYFLSLMSLMPVMSLLESYFEPTDHGVTIFWGVNTHTHM